MLHSKCLAFLCLGVAEEVAAMNKFYEFILGVHEGTYGAVISVVNTLDYGYSQLAPVHAAILTVLLFQPVVRLLKMSVAQEAPVRAER